MYMPMIIIVKPFLSFCGTNFKRCKLYIRCSLRETHTFTTTDRNWRFITDDQMLSMILERQRQKTERPQSTKPLHLSSLRHASHWIHSESVLSPQRTNFSFVIFSFSFVLVFITFYVLVFGYLLVPGTLTLTLKLTIHPNPPKPTLKLNPGTP